MAVDAVVNAANNALQLGSGVAGAIRKKGGPSIQEECDAIGHCEVGKAVITRGGSLKARHVIHAVGPVMGSGNEDRKLADATMSALEVAEANGIRSLAFPAISTGVFGFPKDRCAKVMLSSTIAYLQSGSEIDRVFFCLFDDETYSLFEDELSRLTND
ncbi:macro domain-containing protein [bacterium]|nr:macro domain-containing protein [candidate division CSSED10-310 bacterium]